VFGKVFNFPTAVFDEAMLKPETQDMESFVDGINNVYEAQQRVAQEYFEDSSIHDACPPLKALLHIMANGEFEGKSINDPAIRNLFAYDYLLQSDWYQERLKIKQERDSQLWQRHIDQVKLCLIDKDRYDLTSYQTLTNKLEKAERMLAKISSPSYLDSLQGTLGADWVHH
jgi:phosphoenolpyruvate carboxykinase (diphosphate)